MSKNAGRGPVDSGALRRACAAAEVVERGLVGGDHAAPRPAFDAHVADGHAPLHREGADRFAGEFDEIARAARSGQGVHFAAVCAGYVLVRLLPAVQDGIEPILVQRIQRYVRQRQEGEEIVELLIEPRNIPIWEVRYPRAPCW